MKNHCPALLCVLLLCVGAITASFAQAKYLTYKSENLSKRALAQYNKGREYLNTDKAAKATESFLDALADAPTFIDARILLADSYYAQQNYTQAGNELKRALMIDSLYMPRMLYSLGKYAEKDKDWLNAARYFERFARIDKTELGNKATYLAANNRFRYTAYKNPVPFVPKNMGAAVNASGPEYFPSITADQNTLVFTRRIGDNEDFFVSKKRDGEWTLATNLGPPINTDDNEGAQSISANGKYLVFTACNRRDGKGSCDLYFAEYRNNKWTEPQNMGEPVCSGAWESQPTLSPDGKMLIFASNRKDGDKGGKNLFVTRRDAQGNWATPTPISALNTPYDDETPFLHADGQTLYFSSNGHPGFGGNDLFVSRLQPTGNWGKPTNLGTPINTDKDDLNLLVTLDGKTAIYSTKFADTHGDLDLYTFELPAAARAAQVTYVQAQVADAASAKKMQYVTATLKDVATGQTITTVQTDENGSFLLCLPVGKNYALNVAEKGYTFYSDNFELTAEHSIDKPFLLAIKLQPLQISAPTTAAPSNVPPPAAQPIVLRNVFFNTGSADLKSESVAELTMLKNLLTENPNLRIQVSGHTDNVGNAASNQTLSESRANAVRSFLIQQGIDGSRLVARGFGSTQPIDSNDTENGRKNNRRTEFVVL